LGLRSGYALGFDYVRYGSIETFRIAADDSLIPGEVISPYAGGVNLSYGYGFGQDWSLGLSARYLFENLGLETGSGFSGDAGILYKPLKGFSAGLALLNAGSDPSGSELPLKARAG